MFEAKLIFEAGVIVAYPDSDKCLAGASANAHFFGLVLTQFGLAAEDGQLAT